MTVSALISHSYLIGDIQRIVDMHQGKMSNAKLIETSTGKYILRRLRDQAQAISEYTISQRLSSNNIGPLILLTARNIPYIIFEKAYYNIQEYIDHIPIKNIKINFYHLGNVISIFHTRLKDEALFEAKDRFSLAKMWKELSYKEDFKLNIINLLQDLVQECSFYKSKDNCFIHGDLGTWNLLFKKEDIYIIDFGEVRRGNNHFDIAAALTSTLNMEMTDEEIMMAIAEFERGYSNDLFFIDRKLLLENIKLWLIRGLLAILKHNGITPYTINYTKQIIKAIDRYESLLIILR